MQPNIKSRLYGDKDETIIHIISEFSKLEQREYKKKRDLVWKVIHLELCKKLKFDHTNKRYMHKPEFIFENETHKILWDFEIKTDPLILVRRLDKVIINGKKGNLTTSWFCHSSGSLSENSRKRT